MDKKSFVFAFQEMEENHCQCQSTINIHTPEIVLLHSGVFKGVMIEWSLEVVEHWMK